MTKTCSKCGVEKPHADFYKRAAGTICCSYCKECSHRYKRENYDAAKRKRIGSWERYRLTPEQFDAMLAAQRNRCRICDNEFVLTPARNKHAPNVDHDHESGKVRGLLCTACNFGLGQFKDSPALLESAINYLEAAA